MLYPIELRAQRKARQKSGLRRRPLPTLFVSSVLEEHQPVRQTDLVVAMLEAGYQTTMTPKRLRDAVGVVLRKGRERFREVGGEWALETDTPRIRG